ncbi:MAG: MoaD/ThiS family protein [Anaerolineae bacterium]|nr:MoaD/ThiS family protein [Anaerolineae bacterium]
MATVFVPTPLRRLTGGQSKIEVPGEDIAGLIASLEAHYPGFQERMLDEKGEIKRFINIFVNDTEVRTLQGKATPVHATDQVSIIPAMAGGW